MEDLETDKTVFTLEPVEEAAHIATAAAAAARAAAALPVGMAVVLQR